MLDTAPASGVLPDLIRIAGGEPHRVLTISDFAAALELGARDTGRENATLRYDVLAEFAELAAAGRFVVSVARMFGLELANGARYQPGRKGTRQALARARHDKRLPGR